MEGDLDLPGLERGVRDILLLDDASSFHDIFVADVGEDRRIFRDELDGARGIAKVDEDEGSEIPTIGNPAEKRDFFSDIAQAEFAVMHGSFHNPNTSMMVVFFSF